MAALTVKTQDGEERSFVPVRDKRNKNWHWKLNALHEEIFVPENQEVITFAALLGPAACAVYDYLCRRANEETQSCFPSHPTIAFATGQSEPTVIEALAVLAFFGLIHKENREADEGDPTSNLYFLLPVELWSVDGGKAKVTEDLAKKLTDRRKKLAQRKVPYYLRRRFLPGPKTTVEAVKIFNHPPKAALPPPVKILKDGGKSGIPPLEQDSLEQDSIDPTSTEVARAPEKSAPDVVAVEKDFQSSEQSMPAATPFDEEVVLSQVESLTLELAGAQNIALSPDEARVLVASFPAARFDDAALYHALTVEPSRYGLDNPVQAFGKSDKAREMIERDGAKLRLWLCAWHAFPESRDDCPVIASKKYTKTQCFLAKFNAKTPVLPPKSWLEGEVARLRGDEARRVRLVHEAHSARQQQEFEVLRASLSAPQLARLAEFVRERMESERPGSQITWWDAKTVRAWEAEVLEDAAKRADVMSALESGTSAPKTAPESAQEDTEQLELDVRAAPHLKDVSAGIAPSKSPEMYEPLPREMKRLMMHAQELAGFVQSGKYDLDGAEDDAIGRLYYGPPAAAYLRGLVEQLLADKQKAA